MINTIKDSKVYTFYGSTGTEGFLTIHTRISLSIIER